MKKMYSRLSLTLILFVFFAQISFSQVVISDNASAVPDGSAMLDVQSTSGGILIPRMTSAQRTSIASPAEGLLVYDTNSQSFFIYGKTLDGTAGWIDLSSNAEIWSRKGSSVFLSNSTYNVGIGTSTPTKKLVIKAQNSTDTLLEVQDMNGNPLMVITPRLTKFNIVNPVKGKAVSGGFAVGRYSTAKAATEADLFQVTPDSTRVFTGVSGGFAVGRYSLAKGSKAVTYDGKYMYMVPDNYFIGHRSGDSLQTGKYTGKYNTFFGYQAGMNDTAGGSNVFIGYRSGLNNLGQITVTNDSLGFRNVFLGYEAGLNNTLGSDNVLLGYQAGHEVTTAGNNISIGSGAGYSNTNNSDNIFLGRESGYNHTGTGTANSANNNIYIGLQAGYGDAVSGNQSSNNIFMGTQSGFSNFSGSNNVFLGYQTGYSNTAGLDNIFLGNQAGFNNTEAKNNIFIGINAGFSNNGTTSWDGDDNIFIGNQAGYSNLTGHDNVYLGNQAGRANTSIYNVILGSDAGRNSTGGFTVSIGKSAGQNDVAGNNVYLGNGAATYNVTGGSNVMIGSRAGFWAQAGSQNVIIGYGAGELANGQSLGSRNILIGYNVADNQVDISDKLFIDNSNTGEPLIYGNFISDSLKVNGSLTFNKKSNNTSVTLPLNRGTNGQVLVTDGAGNSSWAGILQEATTASNGLTEVGNDIQLGGTLSKITTISGAYDLRYDMTGIGDFEVLDAGVIAFRVKDNGETYVANKQSIGILTPTAMLHIKQVGAGEEGFAIENDGDTDTWSWEIGANDLAIYFNDIYKGAWNDVDGVYASASDRRLKDNIEEIPSVMDKIRKLEVVEYYFKDDKKRENKSIGLIAQDVEKIFPSIVSKPEDNKSFYSLNYSAFGPIAIKAIQEQQEQIEKQQREIDELRQQNSEIQKLKKEIQELRMLIKK